MRQSPRSFVSRLDFRTSVGTRVGVVVTDLAIFHPDDAGGGELRLDSLHPGVKREQVEAAMGWQPRVAESLTETPPPTAAELRMIREELDPAGVYTK